MSIIRLLNKKYDKIFGIKDRKPNNSYNNICKYNTCLDQKFVIINSAMYIDFCNLYLEPVVQYILWLIKWHKLNKSST